MGPFLIVPTPVSHIRDVDLKGWGVGGGWGNTRYNTASGVVRRIPVEWGQRGTKAHLGWERGRLT